MLSVDWKMSLVKVMLSCLLLAAAGATAQAATEYLLYTRRYAETPERIRPEVESLIRSSFYGMDPVVLSLPEAGGNNSTAEHQTLATALLLQQPCNVFTVEPSADQSEAEIVESVSSLLMMVHSQFEVPLSRQQLVGYGAGAHLAGAVARRVQQELGEQLAHITALDPSEADDQSRHELSAQDALYVEVIHTNGKGLGTMKPLGHADYYPNGGQQQLGCSGTVEANACAHARALQLAAEMWSTSNAFVTAKCSSTEQMSASSCRWSTHRMGMGRGMGVGSGSGAGAESASGIYFLETRSSSPFAQGAYHVAFL